MPIWAIPAIVAFVATVAVLFSLQRRERWKRFWAIGKPLGATEKAHGFQGTDYLVLEGRHEGKRFLLSFYIGSEYSKARVTLQMLVRPPAEGMWRSAADLPQGFSKDSGAAVFRGGATEIEADANGVRASVYAQLSEESLPGKSARVLEALGKLTRSFPVLERQAGGRGQSLGPVVELALLAAAVLALFAKSKGQTLDAIAAFLRALPFGLAVVAVRDWFLRKQLHRIPPGGREAIRRAFWVLYFIAVLMATYGLNQWLDRSEARIIERRILEARIERRHFTRVPIVFIQLGEAAERTRVEVSQKDLEINPGGMKVWLREGAFHVPWMERYEIVEQ